VPSPAAPVSPRFATDAFVVDFEHPAREAAVAALLPRLGERVDAFFAANAPPSIAVAVIVDGEVRLTRLLGWADVAHEVAPTPQTLYRIGSITKTFTTALALQLRDEGKLTLDAPAEQYWPELAKIEYPFPDSARITLRHLLTHSSGLPRLGNFEYASPDANVSDEVLLRALAEARLDSAPGTRYVYSNFGMSLVGFFAGRMSSEGSLRAALAQRVTAPLGMASTTFDPASVPGAALAIGYTDSASRAVAPLWNLGVSEGAGGLWSSLDDMARWVIYQLGAWPPRPGAEGGPLRRATLREQHVASFPIDVKASLEGSTPAAAATGIGLGWHTAQSCSLEQLVEHGGAIDGFRATVAFAPERGFGVVVLSNAVDTRVSMLQDDLVKLAAAALDPREQRPSPGLVAALNAFGESLASCPASAYEALFDRSFRAAIGPEQFAAVCAGISSRSGRCAYDKALSLSTASSGEFQLRCERGALRADAVVHVEDGQTRFSGLRVRPTGFPASAALARAADAALKLYARWDDKGFDAAFANPRARDALRAGFAEARNERGRCKLGPDALTGPYSDGERTASLPLSCERGAPRYLEIAIDPSGKLTGIFLREPAGARRRCN
jgi:CubicO group peptidase (beta-lactamase class C family)